MQEPTGQKNIDPSTNGRPRPRPALKVGFCLVAAALLLHLALASVTLNYLVPTAADRNQGITGRLDWYLHSGQWQADASTLAAALDYIMATDRDASTITNLAEVPVAENAAPSAPKS